MQVDHANNVSNIFPVVSHTSCMSLFITNAQEGVQALHVASQMDDFE